MTGTWFAGIEASDNLSRRVADPSLFPLAPRLKGDDTMTGSGTRPHEPRSNRCGRRPRGDYGILDRVSKGRDEGDPFQLWIRRPDEY